MAFVSKVNARLSIAPQFLRFASSGKWPHPRPNAKRYKGPAEATLTPAQKKLQNEITASRTTGFRGPFAPWLANPSICQPAQQLGQVVRYDIKSLSFPERELAILIVARATDCPGEWEIHLPEARRAGLTDDVVEAVRNDEPTLPLGVPLVVPSSEGKTAPNLPQGADHRLRTVHDFVRSLATTNAVSDELYNAAVEEIGEAGTVEMTVLVGYYKMVAMTVNVFNVH